MPLETHPLAPGLRLARTGAGAGTVFRSTQTIDVGADPTGAREPDGQDPAATLITDTSTFGPDETGGLVFDDINLGPAGASPSDGGPRGAEGIGPLDRPTSIVVIVAVTVVAGILLWIGAFFLFRRYRRAAMRRRGDPHALAGGEKGDEAGLEHGSPDASQASEAPPKPTTLETPPAGLPELDGGVPAIGSTPNPAELEGDAVIQPPARTTWVQQHQHQHQHKSWLRSPPAHQAQSSPRSMQSTRSGHSARRTVRESFGEKVNDPAAALGRLRIPNPLSPMSRSRSRSQSSPASPSPRGAGGGSGSSNSFLWRLPRSPRSPAAARSSMMSSSMPPQVPKLGGPASGPSTPGRARHGPGRQEDAEEARRGVMQRADERHTGCSSERLEID